MSCTNPVVVGQFATVDLQPEVGGELVRKEVAGVTEVGLDVAVGPQEGDHQAVILPWGWPASLIDHDPSHQSVDPERKTTRLMKSHLHFLENSSILKNLLEILSLILKRSLNLICSVFSSFLKFGM